MTPRVLQSMTTRVRPARPGEAAEIAALLRRSITELCAADHQGDPAALDSWLANKTPETVAAWIADPRQRLVAAELDGRLAGVGAAHEDGRILLNYVSPDCVGRGVGSAVMGELEGWLRGRGQAEARLEATRTARGFYRARGYVEGAGDGCRGACREMARPLVVGLVIFDCDGVLVDSEPISLRLLYDTLTEAGVAIDAATVKARFLGRSLASTRAMVAEEFGLNVPDAMLETMRDRLYAAFRAELTAIPGVAETLAGLKAPFCVASSSQTERIRLSLEIAGLLPAFEGRIFSATEVARGKPAPDLFLHAAARMGVPPAACLVVEDSPAGVAAGKAAGMRVVGFTGGGHAGEPGHRAELAALGPEAIIDRMRDLSALL